MRIFFIDTNFFLQCKKYDQLDWSEVATEKDITIFISRPVQKEIDRLKNDGNTRRSRRAREATTIFRQMLDDDKRSFSAKTPKYNIIFKFSEQYSDEVLTQTSQELDMSSNDDKILAIVNKYLADKPENHDSCFFLSNDTNPILTAKINNIPAIKIPDSWLLEPENDERDKEIIKLRQQVSDLQKKEPVIEIDFKENDHLLLTKFPNEFTVKIQLYNQLNQSDIDKYVELLANKHPKKTDFSENEERLIGSAYEAIKFMSTYYPPTEEEIDKYNKAYKNWENDVCEVISGYADRKNKHAQIVPFCIVLMNNGNSPAEHLLLDFDILTGGLLLRPDFDNETLKEQWAYPAPPEPPKGRWEKSHALSILEAFAGQAHPFSHNLNISPLSSRILSEKNRDKNAFYWKDGRPKDDSASWYFECDELRHKFNNEEFSYYLKFNNDSDKIIFRIRLSASNMSSPIEKNYIIHKKTIAIEPQSNILHLIKHSLPGAAMKKNRR